MICAVCKYAPVELFAGFGEPWRGLDGMAESTPLADEEAHINLCGFGKALIEAALDGQVGDLVLTSCCDVMRRSFEVVADRDRRDGRERFLWLMGLPHTCGPCQVELLARQIRELRDAYAARSGRAFSLAACQEACRAAAGEAGAQGQGQGQGPYVGILGCRAGRELEEMVRGAVGLPVRNLACAGSRRVVLDEEALGTADEGAFFLAYAKALLEQVPCMRMVDTAGRRALFEDPNLKAVVYHTMKFCDFYGAERAEVQARAGVPVLSIETDYTLQSAGQLSTRIEAFAESIGQARGARGDGGAPGAGRLFAGIDSGSTSTDVVIVDEAGSVVASRIVATGGGASASAQACLAEALDEAGIGRGELGGVVATGYGRDYLDGDSAVTEITCHARGARALCPGARCVIDIGGQDSKAIALAEDGSVSGFVMNDKCAAGTGRFLEMMARALQLSIEELSGAGLSWREDIAISSMCSVFAESEVVSLVAQSKDVADIVHGLDEAVASKTVSLVRRAGGQGPFVMTGGVSRNEGVVRAIERRLGQPLAVPEGAQLAGALGAALIARDRYGAGAGRA